MSAAHIALQISEPTMVAYDTSLVNCNLISCPLQYSMNKKEDCFQTETIKCDTTGPMVVALLSGLPWHKKLLPCRYEPSTGRNCQASFSADHHFTQP